MELNKGQLNALKIAVERYRQGKRYTTIIGPGGSGKTTVVSAIIQALGVSEEDVAYACYTGKAAKVLQQKGNKNAITLHKLIYTTHQKADGTFIHLLKDSIDYKVVVCDEISMLSDEFLYTLLNFYGVYYIFLGDQAQLSPIEGNYNFLFDEPEAELTEIMRQGEGSEIIKYSIDIKNGVPLPKEHKGKEVQIFENDKLTIPMLNWADIVLCATNKKRKVLNEIIRQSRGYTAEPKIGDKIICCKNNWDVLDDEGNPLVNGTIGYITEISNGFWPVFKTYGVKNNKIEFYNITLQTEEGTIFRNLKVDKEIFKSGNPSITPSQYYKILKNKKMRESGVYHLEEFDFAYAISCWKAQGSEWEKVLVIEENFPFKEEHKKFMYTAITRASKKAIIIKK